MDKKTVSIRWIFVCCWFTYLVAYLCRVNFSSAMDAITLERGLSAQHLGVIGAVFYGIYACGQLVNGYIGDRVPANRFVLLALSGTLLCNLGMSLAPGFGAMLALWGLNGVFQSMFWSTIIRVLAQNIPAEKRATYSMGISLAMPAAYITSWGLLGQCLDGAAVRWYFLLPVIAVVVMIGAWLLLSGKANFALDESTKSKAGIGDTFRFLVEEKLIWMVGVCMLHGLIKEGVAYWTPMLVGQMGVAASPYLLASILPTANLIGIVVSKLLLGKSGTNPFKTLLAVFIGILIVCAALLIGSGGLLVIGLMAVISGLAYANNTILMSFIPMQYTARNMVASIIGVFDFASYVGAAVSTYVFGRVLESYGFDPLPGIWLASAAAAILIAAIVVKKGKTHEGDLGYRRCERHADGQDDCKGREDGSGRSSSGCKRVDQERKGRISHLAPLTKCAGSRRYVGDDERQRDCRRGEPAGSAPRNEGGARPLS